MLRTLFFSASPWIVGLVRGLLEAAALAAIAYAIAWLGGANVPAALVPLAPLLLAGLRFLEGVADQIDQSPAEA